MKLYKKEVYLFNFTMAKSSNSFGCIRDLLSVNMFAVLLNFDSIDVDAGKRQKIALAKLTLMLNFQYFLALE